MEPIHIICGYCNIIISVYPNDQLIGNYVIIATSGCNNVTVAGTIFIIDYNQCHIVHLLDRLQHPKRLLFQHRHSHLFAQMVVDPGFQDHRYKQAWSLLHNEVRTIFYFNQCPVIIVNKGINFNANSAQFLCVICETKPPMALRLFLVECDYLIWYNGDEVIMMSLIEYLSSEIEKLSKNERQELTKKLLEKMNSDEIRVLMEKSKDSKELMGMLKVAEPSFEDWDNEEDMIYDNL